MRSSLHQQVRRTIRRHALILPGDRVLVGLSGGSDSVALTLLLRELAEYGEFEVAVLAHFNHQLRPTAARDEAFCRAFAAAQSLPIEVDTADIRAQAGVAGLSLEDAARRARYAFLERAAGARSATRVAVGHTEDDQAETFLMKLMRGAGLAGLGGIYPRRGAVIRPLLDVSRADLRNYLTARGQTWVEDETNADLDNPRNRIRHRVLPELDLALGGRSRANLARAAGLAREDGEWLDSLADEQLIALASETPSGLALDASKVALLALPLARRVLLKALRTMAAGREVGQDHVDAVMAVASGGSGGVDVPGGRVEPKAGKLVLLRQKAVPK